MAVCLGPMKATSNGAFQKDNPLDFALPLIILQICLIVLLTRGIAFLIRPLRQPRVIAEIIGGILLGPSAIGRWGAFLNRVFPKSSLTVLDTVANIGLLFFLFLVGLELDMRAIRRTGKKALAIALAGISLPFILGIGVSVVLRSTISKGVSAAPFLVFMGVALSITAFPVLARILAELKLLTTDIGRIAMSAAAVNDVAAWILLALAIALSGSGSPLVSLWVLLSGVAFVVFAAFAVRPCIAWMATRSPQGEPVKELYICAMLTAVLAASFLTDAIGIHALFGAFVMGIIVPKEGPFAGALIEKIEDIVSGLFLPLYFVSSGLKTDVTSIRGAQSWGLLVLVVVIACVGKVMGTFTVALAARVPRREALALGFLMNTKGLVELIVLNIGKDRKVLNSETFAIMVLMALFTTFITTPIVMAVYKPARKAAPYKYRTVARPAAEAETELRILACLHSTRCVPATINFIEASRGTRRRGLTVYAMHLMELSERSSAISMVHKARRNGMPFWNKGLPTEAGHHIVVAFEAYQQLSRVSVRPMTAISDLATIHEDIVTSAQEKHVALILLPFHKQQRFDGALESVGGAFRHVNQRVLRHAPCSVGIIIDRGLGGSAQVASSEVSSAIAVLFFGGRDDREALSYALRMAEHPGIKLSVVRFLPLSGNTVVLDKPGSRKAAAVAAVNGGEEDEDHLADAALLDSLQETIKMSGSEHIRYEERTASDKEEIIAAIKAVGRCNLFLVGRTPPVSALLARTDCPELGPVGSYLASSEFSTTASVLVIQQYHPDGNHKLLVEEVEGAPIEYPDTPEASYSGRPALPV